MRVGLLMVVFLLGLGCGGTQQPQMGGRRIVDQSRDERPEWVSEVVPAEEGKFFALGQRTEAPILEGAATDARMEAAGVFLDQLNQEFQRVYERARAERGRDSDPGYIVRDGLRAVVDTQLAGLNLEDFYWEKEEEITPTGIRYRYNYYALMSVPEIELERARAGVYEQLRQRAREENNRAAEEFIEYMRGLHEQRRHERESQK